MVEDEEPSLLTGRSHWKFYTSANDVGLRLDQLLPRHCSGVSRTQARKIIDIGGVHISGRRVRSCSRTVQSNEEVIVYYDGLPLAPYRLSEKAILYRDQEIIALNKPPGIETQPTPARYQGTLYAALSIFLADPFRPHLEPSIGMVQRLDRDTSGVILFSISPKAHKPLTTAITSRRVHKKYLALVAGSVPIGEHEIKSLLARSHRDNSVRSVARGGQEAVTHYRVLAATLAASLVEVTPITGRMHQIRVHLSEAGFPLLGDKRYGGPQQLGDLCIGRHMLHALSLELSHPVTALPMQITAPLPNDFSLLLTHLQLGDFLRNITEELC